MKLSSLAIISASLFSVATQALAAPPRYRVIDLGDLPGGNSYSIAYGINNLGQVVGSGNLGGASAPNAFLWENGSMSYLGDLPGGVERSEAFAINDAGRIVGWGYNDVASTRAVMWENGTIYELGDLPGGSPEARALDVNASGNIVGWSSTSPSIQATMWEGDTLSGVAGGSPTTYANSIAYAINDRNQVVGSVPWASGLGNRAVLWDSDGTVTELGAIGVINDVSQANDINNLGLIIGNSKIDLAGGAFVTHAAMWDNGNIIDLGDLSADTEVRSDALGVNDNGLVVGWSIDGASSRATLWQDGTIYNLNDLLDPADPLSATTVLIQATDINNSGQIVGQALFADGGQRAFLLNPVPVPAAVWLFGSGLLALLTLSRRRT